MRRKECNGGCFAAFGAGLLVAVICPVRFILIVAAISLVLTGISLIRC
ncbi:MAG: hypothetical protein J6Q42_00240 [Clostridia bacterium]|nr:hypothetical protein [Clostridia bacterium]